MKRGKMSTSTAIAIWIVLLVDSVYFADGTEITAHVFGTDTHLLPAAFGDFNSDEITDLFVLRDGGKTVEVLLGSNEAVPLLRAANLKCSFVRSTVTNVVPGDFNGDALMDVLVTTTTADPGSSPNVLDVHVLWGSQTRLNCTDEGRPVLKMRGEPLALDSNNDFITDLFGVSTGEPGTRGIWLFSNSSPPVFQPLQSDKTPYKMRNPHSNAYLDLNNDNVADLFLTVQTQESYLFEEWHGHRKSKFTFYRLIKTPLYAKRKVGQSLFLDLELKGKLDHIVPVLDRANPKILVHSRGAWNDLNVDFKRDGKTWSFLETGLPFTKAVTLRGGDYNMDGYPDLLATLTNGKLNRTLLLENVPCQTGCGNFTRSFKIDWTTFPADMNDTVTGIFYDIFQDGILDVVLVRQFPNGTYHVSAVKNVLDYDANFIKVMVLTGLKYRKNGQFKTVKNTFGTNLPGPRVAYRTVDQDGFVRTGVSCQLPQSAHYSLNLPYIMFALGRTPNFVDNVTVGFAAEHRELLQVIPNSQMVVIPVSIDNPASWKVQLFVTPSKIIVMSVVTLVTTCFFILVIISVLHWQEKKVDRLERLQEAHRFNFDAM